MGNSYLEEALGQAINDIWENATMFDTCFQLFSEVLRTHTPDFDSNSYTSGTNHLAQRDPEDDLIAREHTAALLSGVRKQLSEFEAKILGYYLDGLSCREFALEVGKSAKSVDNAVQRIRRKVAQQILSGEFSSR